MKTITTYPRIIILLSALLFYLLFYSLTAGINVLLIAVYSVCLFLFALKKSPGKLMYLFLIGMIVSSLSVLFAHTDLSVTIFWCCFILFLGNFSYQQINHLHFGAILTSYSVFRLPSTMAKHFRGIKKRSGTNYSAYIRFVFVPVITLVVLFIIYSSANDLFFQSFENFMSHVADFLSTISFSRILFFLLGIIVFSLCYSQTNAAAIIQADSSLSFNLVRRRRKSFLISLNRMLFKKRQMAILLFVILNLMICWLNYLDITSIWFGFQWDGGYLKDMVHEGTYLLIGAIIISIAVSVYYLNSNIVFLRNSRLFNLLVILWLAQNAVMIVSVVLRNTYYINFFALAYKRIFVYFFLAACLIGLISIVILILHKKSVGFLLSVNSLALYLIILCAACFNWDSIIARYNFSHYNKSFVHYNFLAALDDSALAYMNYSEEDLKKINVVQQSRFSFASSEEYTNINFAEVIKKRKENFKKRWETRSWLEWNYPEQKAYNLLFKS